MPNKYAPAIPLLPCPFCGCEDIDPEGAVILPQGAIDLISGPACESCSCSVSFTGYAMEDAARWNNRVLHGVSSIDPSLPRLVRDIRVALDSINPTPGPWVEEGQSVYGPVPEPGKCRQLVAHMKPHEWGLDWPTMCANRDHVMHTNPHNVEVLFSYIDTLEHTIDGQQDTIDEMTDELYDATNALPKGL